MKIIKLKNKVVILMDTTLHSSKEILMVACHHRELIGTIAILTTFKR